MLKLVMMVVSLVFSLKNMGQWGRRDAIRRGAGILAPDEDKRGEKRGIPKALPITFFN